MIATILHSSPTFHAVVYNEKKVMQGCASLLEIKNFGAIDTFGYSDPKELQDYLIQYSSRNDRIKNPQFHLAISCKGHEWTPQQLLKFAHQYLDEMGYGDPEQPLLVYSHHDTDNTHIHIITSRVAPNGKKINDSKEKIRSQKVIEKLLGKNMKEKAAKDVADAMNFNFSDIRQFKSVMEAMKYECFETRGDDGFVCFKKGGMVLARVPKSEVRKKAELNKLRGEDVAERMKWRSIFKKYRDMNSNKISLEKDLRSAFGISLVWLGSKDKPYGYQVVDFNKKKVYDGYKILHIDQLLDFKTKEEHIKEIELFIDKCLNNDPRISTANLNKKLRRFGGYVKKDCIVFGNERILLDSSVQETLNRNNKIAWRQNFHPSSDIERRLICKLSNFDPELIKIEPQDSSRYKKKEVAELYQILSIKNLDEKKKTFEEAGFRLVEFEGVYFAVNMKNNVLIDLSRTDLPESMYSDLKEQKQQQPSRKPAETHNRKIPTPGLSKPYSGHGQNREWEVGRKDKDRDDPDRNHELSY